MILSKISNMMIPFIVMGIIIYSIRKKVDVYDSFIKGCKEGLDLSISIFPYLIAMLFATNILLKSNILNSVLILFKPVFDFIKIPIQIIPMAILRPISGNASFAVMIDLIKQYGVDSYIGKIATTLQGATDTTIYVLSLYFGSIGIKKIRYSLWVGLLTDLSAIIISITLVNLIF